MEPEVRAAVTTVTHLLVQTCVTAVLRRPLWLTEFACSEASSLERLPAEGQMAYMREAIPLLERDESIAMYSWPPGNVPRKFFWRDTHWVCTHWGCR